MRRQTQTDGGFAMVFLLVSLAFACAVACALIEDESRKTESDQQGRFTGLRTVTHDRHMWIVTDGAGRAVLHHPECECGVR